MSIKNIGKIIKKVFINLFNGKKKFINSDMNEIIIIPYISWLEKLIKLFECLQSKKPKGVIKIVLNNEIMNNSSILI